jgi:hypothetical protein
VQGRRIAHAVCCPDRISTLFPGEARRRCDGHGAECPGKTFKMRDGIQANVKPAVWRVTRRPNRSTSTEPSFRSAAAMPMSIGRLGPGRFRPLVSPRATMDTTAQCNQPSAPGVPGTQGRSLDVLNGFARIEAVLQRVSCCRAEPLIPAHHHAFGNAFFRLPSETRRACPTAFWPTAQARQHRVGITRMIARHLFDCAGTESAQPPVRQ